MSYYMQTSHVTVRIGILVERFDDDFWKFKMFHCRKKDVNIREWANEEVGLLMNDELPVRKMKIGEKRRYWVHMHMVAYRSYYGEWDSETHILSIKRAK